MKLGRKKCPQCKELVAVARKICLNCSYSFRKTAVCVRDQGSLSNDGMTSSRLRTNTYEAVREKTIFPLVARLRQQSQNMDQTKLDENATSSDENKVPVLSYNKEEEKENSCSTHLPIPTSTAPEISMEGSNNLVIEEELDAGVIPSVDVQMSENETPNTEPSVDVTSSQHDSIMSSSTPDIHVQTPTVSSTSPPSQQPSSKTFKFHDNTFETMKALEQIQGQFKQSQSWQSTEQSPSNLSNQNISSVNTSPKVETQTPTIVPRKRGRPKGSTTKNRRVKNLGGLNLWAPKSSKSRLSTLELLALSTQRQNVHHGLTAQQNDPQAMLNLLMQQQLQQQMMSMSSTQDAVQLLMACDATLQQAYSEQQQQQQQQQHQQQQALLLQQQLLLGAHNEQKLNGAQTNHLLEMQLQHEISNLEKILAAHANEQKLAAPKVSQTMDLGMYQLNNLAAHTPVQAGLNGATNQQVLKYVPGAEQFQSVVSDSLQKEAQQNALLRETMMKLQGQTLQSSSSHISPNGIFSTANNGLNPTIHQSVSSADHVMGYSPSLSSSAWSTPSSLDSMNLPAAPIQAPAQAMSSPIVSNNSPHHKVSPGRTSDVSDDETKQFLELIKSLGNDPAQTEQLLQLLSGQVAANAPQPEQDVPTSTPQLPVPTSFSQPQPNQSLSAPATPLSTTSTFTSPSKSDALSKMSDLEQLISCLKSPNQQKAAQSVFTPKMKSSVPLDHLLPKTRGRPPGTPNGNPANLKPTEGKRHRGRPRKYPEHFYNIVNGKMKYPGAKERRMFFPFEETKYTTNSTAGLTQLSQTNSGNNTTPDQTAVTPGSGQTPAPNPTATPTPPPKKRGRPKGSKNKPCLITSPQQLLDLRTAYPESSPIWAGMPDCKQAQIAAVLSGLNHKLFRQNPSFTV